MSSELNNNSYQTVLVRSRRCYSEGRHCVSACRQSYCSSSTASVCWRTTVTDGTQPSEAWSTWCWSKPECWGEHAESGHQAGELPTDVPQTRGKLSFLHMIKHCNRDCWLQQTQWIQPLGRADPILYDVQNAVDLIIGCHYFLFS